MVESFGEDDGVRDGDVAVEDTERRCMQRLGGQQARDEIDIARCIAIGRDVKGQMRDNLI